MGTEREGEREMMLDLAENNDIYETWIFNTLFKKTFYSRKRLRNDRSEGQTDYIVIFA